MVDNFALLRRYFAPQRGRVLLLTALLVSALILQLVNPQLVRYVLDTAQAGATPPQLALAAVLFVIFGLLQAGASLGADYVGENISWLATNALRVDLVRHCLQLDMGFHNNRTPGELIERVDGDVSELANFFSQLVLRVISNGLLILGVIVLLLREDWRLGAAALVYALLTLGILQALQERNVRYWGAFRQATALLNGFLEERLAGLEDVRGNGAEGYVLRGLALAQRTLYAATYQARIFGVWLFAFTHLLFVGATTVGFGLGIYLFLQGQVTIGAVYLILHYLALLREPLEQIRNQVNELQQSTASSGRIRQLLATQPAINATTLELLPNRQTPAIHPAGEATDRSPRALSVVFERVSFGYARIPAADTAQQGAAPPNTERTAVLHDLSFTLPAGQVLGLLGRTGSGKTTLTRLLFRLYDVSAGQIYLDGQELRTLPQPRLRQAVGMVTQEVQLFQATLRDNITLFNPAVTDEEILAVLRELGLWSWYSAQALGLETPLQAGGQGLSAGEAQLLAFVRVFLKNPGLVILDEASSRLDPATEVLLERATDRLLAGRTGIIIAHRLPTVQRADQILILEGGRMVELGDRRALAADPRSRFAKLLQTGQATGQPLEQLEVYA